MAQSHQQWRSRSGEIAWLSALVATFERLAEPDERAKPCDPDILAAAKIHLAHPVGLSNLYGSHFSLRN
jgi:hypothetical protein